MRDVFAGEKVAYSYTIRIGRADMRGGIRAGTRSGEVGRWGIRISSRGLEVCELN